jgi:hypothetical protein
VPGSQAAVRIWFRRKRAARRPRPAWYAHILPPMGLVLPDQLTVARIAVVPLVVVLFEWDFPQHDYWATAVFAMAMGTDWLDG